MRNDSERIAWLRLALATDLAPEVAVRLVAALGSALQVASASVRQLRRLLPAGKAADVVRSLRRAQPGAVMRQAAALDQAILTPADPGYPRAAFAGLADPPCALFLLGRLPPREAPVAAIVGTREASPYGLDTARSLSRDLAAAGVWIVSGLALGIDGAAHEGALDAEGPTFAVLGCGLDVPYPAAHVDLKEHISSAGGLLAEHPPGEEPRPWHFPRRNRLVAALAQVVVVVEAPRRSGALITARLALDLGRDVLVVPGSVRRPQQAGSHRLLKQGAAGLCEGADDVLERLGIEPEAGGGSRGPPQEGTQAVLWRLLDEEEAIDANQLCRRAGLGASEVAAALSELEIDGRVQRIPGVGFTRR